MSYSNQNFSVAGTAVQLVNPIGGSISDPVPVAIFNNDSTNTLYIGGPNVTSANGFPIIKQTGITFKLMASDPVWGVSAGAAIDTRVMIGRV